MIPKNLSASPTTGKAVNRWRWNKSAISGKAVSGRTVIRLRDMISAAVAGPDL